MSDLRQDERVIRVEGEVLGAEEETPQEGDRRPSSATFGPAARFYAALGIAVVADLTQFALLPLFGEGFASPLNDALDVIVAAIMCTLLGVHWQFLPSFVSELVPVLNIAPAWTIAVLWVRRNERRIAESAPN